MFQWTRLSSLLLLQLLCSPLFYGFLKTTEYKLSSQSECYNTRYFICHDFDSRKIIDTTYYVSPCLPESFVVEVGMIQTGEELCFVYNNNKELRISNKGCCLIVGGKRIDHSDDSKDFVKISLYFVNDKMVVYLNDEKKSERCFRINKHKKIGIKKANNNATDGFFYCYEPIPFKEVNYGMLLEEGRLLKSKEVRMYPHNVGADYSLTYPTDITFNSKRSIRFEYRKEDSQNEDASQMQRGRSELSCVYSHSPQNKWIIEYDIYLPEETVDDDQFPEIITQIHEGSNRSTSPAFSMQVRSGWLCCVIRGDKEKIEQWGKRKQPEAKHTGKIIYLQKKRWYHVKLYVKEGWRCEMIPFTKIWVDGVLLYESEKVNCYSYEPRSEGNYNYLKFGVYKSGWLTTNVVQPELRVRTYIFDNFVVKY